MDRWFRYVLISTAIFNLFGAVIFALPIFGQEKLSALPQNTHPLYLWIISSWIFILGVAYLWLAFADKPEPLFIAVAAAAKLAIALIFFTFWMLGELKFSFVLSGCVDLFYAMVFIYWLLQTSQKT
ncbi:hypothetical protein H6G18_15820 [Anabaena subtropica FACHB-260]|uniref:Uncharacterized protein n=1 Tax=Anabaena subtropica FACHB-260 TaxID=2692884 RepID=A0ABR8CQY7_9NOST|nr:hypothetical protein [Anabaena subtropica FACHB-260]